MAMSSRVPSNLRSTRAAETGVPDGDYEAERPVFSDREMVDLTIPIGLTNTSDRMAMRLMAMARLPAFAS